MANVLGLAVARHAALRRIGIDVREQGLQAGSTGAHVPRLLCYGSAETHSWARKAVELLGLGNASLRLVAVDSEYRMSLRELKETVARDRSSGAQPCCVLATAGTVNTGATDDLLAVAEFCRNEQIWLHVDGAFGALLRLSERLRDRVRGIELADSLGFDLHKWGYLPFECACLLVRDAEREGHHRLVEQFRARALGTGVALGIIALGGIFVLRADAPRLYQGLTGRAQRRRLLFGAAGRPDLARHRQRLRRPAGEADAAAVICACSASFSCIRRCCQLPAATHTTIVRNAATVGTHAGRRCMAELASTAGACAFERIVSDATLARQARPP